MPEGKDIKYVPITNEFMFQASNIRDTLSTDTNHPTGAVVVKDNKIIGLGANQSVLKSKTLISLHKRGWCLRKILKIPSGQKYWLCPGCASCKQHAETRATLDAVKKDLLKVSGSDLYLHGHWWCCKPCWDVMIANGIRDVYLLDQADSLFKK